MTSSALGGGAELAEVLGEVLQGLDPSLGRGVFHGFEHLGFTISSYRF